MSIQLFPRIRHTFAAAFAIVALSITLFTSPAASQASEPPEFPRPTMRAVFDDIKTLIPLSMHEERWRSAEEREAILATLARLEKSAEALERHGRDREPGFNRIALNLISDLGDAHSFYQRGQYDEARFLLFGSLQSCMACHVRLASDRSFPMSNELMESAEIQALEPRDRAWMLVTVRRFDEALTTWEGLIRDETIAPSQLDSSGVLADYLNVAIRVRGEIGRALKTLSAFASRPDLPFYLNRRVSEWRTALSELKRKNFTPGSEGSLKRGVELAKNADRASESPYGRDGLVQDLAAASHLVRWLEQDHARRGNEKITRNRTSSERQQLALAYYWLGVVEARSLDGFWLNLSEQHLEASVRADPKGPMAEKAYALLEETQVLGYGGSSGVHLPADVWSLLKELRELMGLEN